MKNFLIPTTLESDTIAAVKSAIGQAHQNGSEIILMLTTETPDTFSSSHFLREMRTGLTSNQEEVLETCRYIVEHTKNCKIKVHNQCGLSSLIFKGLIDFYAIKLIIFPHSYKQETKRIHQYLFQLATNQKCPILHLGLEQNEGNFNKALYIENRDAQISIENIQQFLNENFPLEIVSKSPNFEENYNEVAFYLTEAISKYNIDMLVETRKRQKIKFRRSKKEDFNEKLGIPVLSLYEELV
ncbi:hypothetical protein [Flavobacterium sp. UMI-01]|uniref:hypothetical protein n=1 Tax=Flavobacterium sp. UMI-01 TaxID=1441053 RepID=UPI001C7CD278|nr:hypothetical protein [Flavobacterium sp. UMI-01]GIZ08076.1 hypothetical protein FUMI01_08030 [Flavobacterium sp. UMI-01]